MSPGFRGNSKTWEVRASSLARNTHNPIRQIVENLQVEPHPDKPMIALSIGDPTTFGNLNPPEEVLDAVRESIEANSKGYAPSVGYFDARCAVAEYCSHQGDVKPEDVILCSGCSHSLDLCVSVLADVGENILVPNPGFMICKTLAEGLGVNIKFYNLLPEQQWQVDLEDLENKIDEKTAAILVINPSNPCGSVYTKTHLEGILAIASRNRVPIIADEIYEHLVFSNSDYHSMASLSKDVPILTCGGIAKRFLVPGWRLGWVIINDKNGVFGAEVRHGLINLSQRILGPNTIVQHALPKILRNTPQTFYDNVINFLEQNAKMAFDFLSRIDGITPIMPQGSMYMMIRLDLDLFPTIKDDLEFVEQLVSEESVFCLPGKCFYYPNYMRIVLTVPEDIMREACQRIAMFCERHVQNSNTIICDIDEDIKLFPAAVMYHQECAHDHARQISSAAIVSTK